VSPRILDAGCGTGRNLVEFGHLGQVEGVDLSTQAVEFCHQRGFLGVRAAALESLPFEDGRFDLIFATDVIEHIDDDMAALAELRRVAAPGAHLVITVPAYAWLWSWHDRSWHHKRRYTRRLLRDRTSGTGWKPEVETYFFTTLLPPVALLRALSRLRSDDNRRSDLHLSPGPLNRWLELPVHAEATLIERGVSLPAGVSLGMVCTPN
jgi:SAM-dependent methyltransferase